MEPQTLLLTRAPPPLSMPLQPRLLFHRTKALFLVVILIYFASQFVKCETCFKNEILHMLENEKCNGDIHNASPEVEYFGDISNGYLPENEAVRPSLESICSNSNLFCFPSTLPGYFDEDNRFKSEETSSIGTNQAKSNSSWSSEYGIFMSPTGQTISCSSNSQSGTFDDLLFKTVGFGNLYASSCGKHLHKQKYSDDSKTPHIEVTPSKLDWGKKSLYAPSFEFITVANTDGDNNLFLFEPFSTDSQFYPCNSTEMLLRPGEVASICFVFLPTSLGISTAHLVLQTSSGEFLIQAKGFGVESPYKVQLLGEPGISSIGRWNRNLSLFNPFDETLSVEEVTVWISIPLGNGSYLTKTVCKIESSEISDEFSVSSTKAGKPLMAMRPLNNWNIAPGGTEVILNLEFLRNFEENAFGAFCAKLATSSQGKSDTIVVPLEANLNGELNNFIGHVSASIETLPNSVDEAPVFALSLKNKAHYLLNVIKIGFEGEGSELFQVKYVEGLMLFPGIVTQVAVIGYIIAPDIILDQPFVDMKLGCSLIILTNDSTNPQVEVPCKEIVTIHTTSYVYSQHGKHVGKPEIKNSRIESLQSSVNSSPVFKAAEATEPDELILENWKSQATASGISVLDQNEVIYPVIQVGNHHSKLITVRNPSPYPVLMQLILNSGEIIDECKELDGFSEPSSSSLSLGEYSFHTKYGFFIAKNALTEAYVLPYGSASFGPVVFHPTKRCGWRSSALIRNNLSGVEWVYLRGFGGSFSLSLFEYSNIIQNLEFNFNLPSPLNLSLDNFHQSEDTTRICFSPLLKELYAKNTGEVPLYVKKIEVSGAECKLNGFSVHSCKGFSLQPGESIKLQISYKPDFSAVMVQRDLELALGSGILVIPMKANIPIPMFNLCKKSIFWIRIKRLSYLILFATGLMVILFFYIPPFSISFTSQDYFTKSRKRIAIFKRVGKTYNKKKNNTKYSTSSKINGSRGSVGEEEILFSSKEGITAPQVKPTEYQGQVFLVNKSKDVQEELKDGNLTVKIGKEKGKKRRKKKGSVVGLTGIFEVSSSQSGNSTPSSPLSPLTSFTPKKFWAASSDVDEFVKKAEKQNGRSSGTKSISKINMDRGASMKRSENSFFRAQEKPSITNLPGKPVLLQSATFPSSRKSSPLFSKSTIPPHARAPGSKIIDKKTIEAEVKTGVGHQFEYDIWGDHLFGRQMINISKKSYVMASNVMENHSDSFFVSGPQTLYSFEEG